jgi:hypothetical protein
MNSPQVLVIIWHVAKNLQLDRASLKMMPVDTEMRQSSNQYVIQYTKCAAWVLVNKQW